MSALDDLFQGEWLDFFTGTAISQTSEGIVALFVVAAVVLPTWYRSGHLTIPAVLLVLFSGLLLPMLPGSLNGVLWGIIWLAGSIALFVIMSKAR